MSLLCLLFVISTVFPGTIDVYGHLISTGEWWANGSGFVLSSALLLLGSSAIMMLKRIAFGRIIHIAGWVSLYVGAFIVARINDVTLPSSVQNLYAALGVGSTIVFATYLYFGKGVRRYFDLK